MLKLNKGVKLIEISKELLSEVLEREVTDFEYWDNNEYRCTAYFDGFRQRFFLNIYELAHKCKEWALSKDYHINTSEDRFNNYLYLYKMFKDDFGYSIDKNSGVQFDSNDYINDLIKACEWILTKSNKKD